MSFQGPDMNDLALRPAVAADAETIAGLANQLSLHEGYGDQVFSKSQVLQDGFGAAPAFDVLLAGVARRAVETGAGSV